MEELKKLKVQDLKTELAKYGLSQVGKKDEVHPDYFSVPMSRLY